MPEPFHLTMLTLEWLTTLLIFLLGLGLRRFLVGTLWADIGGEQIVGPDTLGTALAASAQLGIRLPLGKRVYLDSYGGYRYPIRTGESGTLFGRREGVYGGVRFGL